MYIINTGEEWIIKKPFRTKLYDNVKKRLRHVRIGVAVSELCMRTSHRTYQCSPECNQTWNRIYLLLILQLWFFFFLVWWLEECASLCVCVCSDSGRMKVLTVSIWKPKHAFSRPKTVTKVPHKAWEIMTKRKTSDSRLDQAILCTVMFCVVV